VSEEDLSPSVVHDEEDGLSDSGKPQEVKVELSHIKSPLKHSGSHQIIIGWIVFYLYTH